MGRPKLSLPFGDELLLPRVVRILNAVTTPVVVVAAPGQSLPPLPSEVQVVRDEQEHLGPLAGLSLGLTVLQDRVEAVYASACDVPLLRPEFVRAVVTASDGYEAALPNSGGQLHPLAAVYRTALAARAREFLAAGHRRLLDFVAGCDAVLLQEAELRAVDPDLDSLHNINTPADYASALRRAGLGAAGCSG